MTGEKISDLDPGDPQRLDVEQRGREDAMRVSLRRYMDEVTALQEEVEALRARATAAETAAREAEDRVRAEAGATVQAFLDRIREAAWDLVPGRLASSPGWSSADECLTALIAALLEARGFNDRLRADSHATLEQKVADLEASLRERAKEVSGG